MKILEVIPYFIPAYSYGGPIKVCFEISRELTKCGHNITVATTDTLDGKNRILQLKEKIDGIMVVRFKNVSNWLAKNCNGYLPLGFYFWARKNIRNFDVVHCHDFFTLQNIVVAYFCKKYSVPFVIQPHGSLSPIRQDARFSLIKKIFLKIFYRVLRDSKNIIALTENEKEEIIHIDRKLEKKIKVIPNGIHLEEFENINKIDLHRKYNIPRENKIIGYIGRIQFIKGLDITLDILSQLKDKIKFTYLIIGPDEGEKEKLEKQIEKLNLKENVIFAGILTGQEKLETIKSCDLFLFTSRNEGLPMAILEIAALGIPQIISKECHVPEIERYGGGFEFSLKEKDQIAGKILEILSNQNERDEIKQKSTILVRNHFELKKTVSKLIEIFKR